MRISDVLKLLCSVLFMLQLAACTSDDEPDVTPPGGEDATNGMVIYEANPALFAETGALNALASHFTRIKGLGVNVLWLMPIQQLGVKDAVGSPYCVKDYRSVNSAYGTLADLKALVSKAHTEGMLVILDWVANHTSWDHAWTTEHKDWYTQDAGGNIVSPPGMGWDDVADLNYDNSQMRAAMQEEMLYWVTEADIDGFRCDHAEGVPDDFWKETITKLRSAKEGLLMLAEGSQTTLYDAGFDMLYAWNFAYKLQDVYGSSASVADLYEVHRSEFASATDTRLRMRYSTNHDMASEKSPVQAYLTKEGALSAFVASISMGGCPLIYSSQELAYDKALSFFGYQSIDWNANADYQADYAKLMQIYRNSPALQHGDIKLYQTGKAVCTYRTSATQRVLVLINTLGSVQRLNLPMERTGDSARNLLTGENVVLPRTITLEPYQYFIWQIVE